jgi:hypothetical protein
MLRNVLVVIHATSGVAGLAAGLFSLAPPRPADGRGWARRLYSLCIAVLLASMVLLVAMDWNDLDAGARLAFGALSGLGAVMGYRIVRARQEALTRGVDWQDRYIGHVYFTYISLWEGSSSFPPSTCRSLRSRSPPWPSVSS